MAGSPRFYSVAFVEPKCPVATLLGSGTLINFGNLYGVLTAAHVLECGLRKVKELGFAQFATRPAQPQGVLVRADCIDAVQIGQRPFSETGPDLAFVRLPDEVVGALKANSSFLNLVQEAELLKSPAPVGAKTYDIIVGAVAEWSEPDPSKGLDIGIISGPMTVGEAVEIAAHGGCDRLEFTPRVAPELPAFNSYGGTSGGGLWRLHAQLKADGKEHLIQARLFGVAYFELLPAKASQKIICNGPNSIYRELAAKIQSLVERSSLKGTPVVLLSVELRHCRTAILAH